MCLLRQSQRSPPLLIQQQAPRHARPLTESHRAHPLPTRPLILHQPPHTLDAVVARCIIPAPISPFAALILRKPRLEGRVVSEDGQNAWPRAALKWSLEEDQLEVVLEEMRELFALDLVDCGC
jgi:hypothetical protein